MPRSTANRRDVIHPISKPNSRAPKEAPDLQDRPYLILRDQFFQLLAVVRVKPSNPRELRGFDVVHCFHVNFAWAVVNIRRAEHGARQYCGQHEPDRCWWCWWGDRWRFGTGLSR